MIKKVLKVEGMSCDHCVQAVTKATTALPGVESVSVDLAAGTVTLEYDPNQSAEDAIKEAIEDQGFDVVA
jgi:copper chaperone